MLQSTQSQFSTSCLLPSDKPAQCCGAWEFVAVLYLSLPLLLFFAFFTKLWIAVPALATIVVVLNRARPRADHRKVSGQGPDTRVLLICGAISALFLWVCGYAEPFGRTFDWLKHFAVINELGAAFLATHQRRVTNLSALQPWLLSAARHFYRAIRDTLDRMVCLSADMGRAFFTARPSAAEDPSGATNAICHSLSSL